jgi:thioredoxin-related protein
MQMIYTVRMLFLLIFLCNFFAGNAKTENKYQIQSKGIQWTSGLSWEELKKKAHDENKYIFLDCYATWCQPCKAMDKQVYPNDTIGNLMNSKFICVKIQIDSTTNDNEEIRKWYATVKSIKNEFAVTTMPTFLFFAPNGQIIHKEVGGRSVKQFISLVANATDPSKQYYTLLRLYKEGRLNYAELPSLAKMALSNNEKEPAFELARSYMTGYLDYDERRYFIKENQQFIYDFSFGMLRSTDKLFLLYLQQSKKIDSVLTKPNNSQEIVDFVITKEEINPAINSVKEKSEPEWRKIADKIEKNMAEVIQNEPC